jgi:serine/threonine-protein kinase ULK4
MAEIMKDKNEKVRRKAAAALGEYLFYGATQIDEDASNVKLLDLT